MRIGLSLYGFHNGTDDDNDDDYGCVNDVVILESHLLLGFFLFLQPFLLLCSLFHLFQANHVKPFWKWFAKILNVLNLDTINQLNTLSSIYTHTYTHRDTKFSGLFIFYWFFSLQTADIFLEIFFFLSMKTRCVPGYVISLFSCNEEEMEAK